MDGFLICTTTLFHYYLHCLWLCLQFILVRSKANYKNNDMLGFTFSHRFVGNLLRGQTVGVIGAGRIGSAYARMMVIVNKLNITSVVIKTC